MSWQEEYLARYEQRLREGWTVEGQRLPRMTVKDRAFVAQIEAQVRASQAPISSPTLNANEIKGLVGKTPDLVPPKIAYSAEEIASLTGLSVQFIRNDLYAGRLPSKKYGRRRLVRSQDLDEYLERGSEGTKATNTREICGND